MIINKLKEKWFKKLYIFLILLPFIAQANADVTVTFRQVGKDVVATWNGSFSPGNFQYSANGVSLNSYGGPTSLQWTAGFSGGFWRGSVKQTSLSLAPTSATGGGFGFNDGWFFFSGSMSQTWSNLVVDFGSNSDYTMTWTGKTLENIGASSSFLLLYLIFLSYLLSHLYR